MIEYRKYLRNQTLPGMSEMETDMMKKLPIPPIEKPLPEDAETIALSPPSDWPHDATGFFDLVRSRASRRRYAESPLAEEQLSRLLWATQGVKKTIRGGLVTVRTVPSGGAMHPFETYLAVRRVSGVKPGLYRYVATAHRLVRWGDEPSGGDETLGAICNGQAFVNHAAVVFVWAVRPYRTEYRYGEDSLKDVLISAGHIAQNLYLACEALGLGTCAILAYQQAALDRFLGLDGIEEIPIYLAPVGPVATA